MFARMQEAVEMWPCSMSATGRPRVSMAARKSAHVGPRGRGGVELDVFLRQVLGILLALVDAVLMDRLAAALGMKS